MVLCADYPCAYRDELVDKENERHQLVVQPHGRHCAIAATRQHEGVDSARKHHQGDLYENRKRELPQLRSQTFHCFGRQVYQNSGFCAIRIVFQILY